MPGMKGKLELCPLASFISTLEFINHKFVSVYVIVPILKSPPVINVNPNTSVGTCMVVVKDGIYFILPDTSLSTSCCYFI